MQKQTVEALSRLMPPGGRVFLQSDVLEVRCAFHPALGASCWQRGPTFLQPGMLEAQGTADVDVADPWLTCACQEHCTRAEPGRLLY